MTPPGEPTKSNTATLTDMSQPRIGPGFRLQFEPAQDCHVLLFPEGMVKLNQSAGEIMKRCDGKHSLTAIIDELEHAFSAKGLDTEVKSFVETAARQRWLVWE
jgi:pyrroloquinoline quinone biosynthesis protein D